eukprot:gene5867-9695_t
MESKNEQKTTITLVSATYQSNYLDINGFLEHLTQGFIKDEKKYYLKNEDFSFNVRLTKKSNRNQKIQLHYKMKQNAKVHKIKEFQFNNKSYTTIPMDLRTNCFLKDRSKNYRKQSLALIFEIDEEIIETPYFSIVGRTQFAKIVDEATILNEIEKIQIGHINPTTVERGKLMRIYLSPKNHQIDEKKLKVTINSKKECQLFSLVLNEDRIASPLSHFLLFETNNYESADDENNVVRLFYSFKEVKQFHMSILDSE